MLTLVPLSTSVRGISRPAKLGSPTGPSTGRPTSHGGGSLAPAMRAPRRNGICKVRHYDGLLRRGADPGVGRTRQEPPAGRRTNGVAAPPCLGLLGAPQKLGLQNSGGSAARSVRLHGRPRTDSWRLP